jgi:hypothetical protein
LSGSENLFQEDTGEYKRKQDEYMSSMRNWKGASHTTSKHVTHFIALDDDQITVEAAVQSVLPVPSMEVDNWSQYAPSTEPNESMANSSIGIKGRFSEMKDTSCLSCDSEPLAKTIVSTSQISTLTMETIGLTKGIEPQFRHDPSFIPMNRPLTPMELLAMGSIWFLPKTAPRDPSMGQRPVRLQVQDLHKILEKGDYLRIHHNPRRFPVVACYDWGKLFTRNEDSLPGVIVARDDDKGYLIVHKPPGSLPVHATVDNILENVCAAVGRAMVKTNQTRIYVSAPQRLDHDTSGIFVVSIAERFSSYFARLLRQKTDSRLGIDSNTKTVIENHGDVKVDDGVHKKYKCLVCLLKRDVHGKHIYGEFHPWFVHL